MLKKYLLLLNMILIVQAQDVDLIIFSYNRPIQLYALLESIQTYTKGTGTVHVLYRADDQYAAAYQETISSFSLPIQVYRQSNVKPRDDFKPLLMKIMQNIPTNYMAFAVDDIIITNPIDFHECSRCLDQYPTIYAFYLRLHQDITYCYTKSHTCKKPPFKSLGDTILLWQFQQGSLEWDYPHSVDFTIFRTAHCKNQLKNIHFNSPNTLEGRWAPLANHKGFGACYQEPKIVNIPLNLVQTDVRNRAMHLFDSKQLLELFNQGMKIDISELHNMHNKSPHIDFTPHFIPR